MRIGADAVVEGGTRCWLALSGARGPLLTPMAYWSDGDALWLYTRGGSVKVGVLAREPSCAVYVAGLDGGGVLLRGRARIHSPTSPRSLVFHGATAATAMAALAVRNAASIVGSVQDGPQLALRRPQRGPTRPQRPLPAPRHLVPSGRVVVRIGIDEAESVGPPLDAPGIAPPLPTVVPAGVRRALAGRRDVVVAVGPAGALAVAPAVWGPAAGVGFSLSLPGGRALPQGSRAAAALDVDPGGRPSAVAGLSVSGAVVDGRLRADRVAWWRGFAAQSADLRAAVAGGGLGAITLPA